MQLRVDPPNAKAIRALAKEYKKVFKRRKSYAAIGNAMITYGLAADTEEKRKHNHHD